MESQNVAIAGLGRVGERFLERMLDYQEKGRVNLVSCAELNDTDGCEMARSRGIPLESLADLAGRGDDVDIIFDLTGSNTARQELREAMVEQENHHTVIAPENVARMMWSLIGTEDLPEVHGNGGY